MIKRRNVLLVVELEKISPWQKARFDREMRAQQWSPVEAAQNAAYATMMFGSNTESSIVRRVTTQMNTAGSICGEANLEGVCVIEDVGQPELQLVGDSTCD